MEASLPAPRPSDHVGVRELRQNLSVYLRRIAKGEEFTVTDHGRPVARLTSLPAPSNFLDRLVAEGKVEPPLDRAALDRLVPKAAPAGTPTTARILNELREDIV